MGDFWNENDDVDDTQDMGDGPAELRKAHRAATRKIKELEAKLTELTDENAKLTKRVRNVDIADLLPKGVSPKVAKLIAKDDVEPTAEAVKAWLDEYGDVFNIKADETTEPQGEDEDSDGGDDDASDGKPQLDEATLAALAGLSQVSAGGSAIPAGAAGSLVADVEANAKTQDDVIRIMQKHGIEVKSGY